MITETRMVLDGKGGIKPETFQSLTISERIEKYNLEGTRLALESGVGNCPIYDRKKGKKMKLSNEILLHQKLTGEPSTSLSKRSGVSIDTIFRIIAGKGYNSRSSEKIMQAIETFQLETAPMRRFRIPKK